MHYFDSMEYIFDSLLFSPFSLTYLCYYNGNIENYKKNVMTYINKLNDLIYTDYYLNEANRRKEEEFKKNKRLKEKNKRLKTIKLKKDMIKKCGNINDKVKK